MGSHLGLIGFALVALFATSMIKFVAVAALAWGAYKTYDEWGACNEYFGYGHQGKIFAFCKTCS